MTFGARLYGRLGAAVRRHRLTALGIVVFVVLLILFLVVEALGVPLLTDPTATLHEAGALAGALSVGLLVVDVVVPLPSSVVMTVNGALFGAVTGALLSLLGGTLATVLAVAIGRRGGPWIERLVPSEQRLGAHRVLRRYGTIAVAATRPVPLIAETVAIIAGTARMSWKRAILAGAVGNLVPATAYAIAGATAVGTVNQVLVACGVMLATAMLWLVGRTGLRSGDERP